MSVDAKIAFLGAGNMAGAIVSGLLEAGATRPERILAADPRPERLEELAALHRVRTTSDNVEAVGWADVVVLATKPQTFDFLLPEIAPSVDGSKLVVSIAAGVPIEVIAHALPAGTRIVRTMPNTPALVGAGATAIASGPHATDEDVLLVQALFESVGATVVLAEDLLDAVTGLSGSGPAFVFVIIEALADAGVEMGLPRDAALRLASQTVAGSAQLQIETGEHPGRLKDMVTSPGGTTIAGLHALESGGLRAALFDAVQAACRRSKELGALAAAKKS